MTKPGDVPGCLWPEHLVMGAVLETHTYPASTSEQAPGSEGTSARVHLRKLLCPQARPACSHTPLACSLALTQTHPYVLTLALHTESEYAGEGALGKGPGRADPGTKMSQ